LRTGPLVRRGANVSRAGQATLPAPRLLPRAFPRQRLSLTGLPLTPIISKPENRTTCRLPINLRSFLAAQLGCHAEAGDETILSCAAHADQSTLNKLARAIRRYSTARAHESWAECSVAVARFVEAYQRHTQAVICLWCVRLDFGDAASRAHQGNRCLPVSLAPGEFHASATESADDSAMTIPERIQRRVEEFRALRIAFGLPHFDLDCYVRGEQLTLMWHPLP
jgi:hypothetical protein